MMAVVTSPKADGRSLARRVVEVGGSSLNFDYAHFLPSSPKCGVLHGHTASVRVGLTGRLVDDMVVEFGELKDILRSIINMMDHKLIVSRKYVKIQDGRASISFRGIGGEYMIETPVASIYVIDSESTSENISAHIAALIRERMPENVSGIYVRLSEGLNKWSISTVDAEPYG